MATDDKLIITLKPKTQNMVYHIFQIHSDKHYIIQHVNTNSDCPINAVRRLLDIFTDNDSHIKCELDEVYELDLASRYAFENIPFVKKYVSDKGIEIEQITYSDYLHMRKMVIDYITTPTNAVAVINWMQDAGFDSYFIELIDTDSKFVEYITTYSPYY